MRKDQKQLVLQLAILILITFGGYIAFAPNDRETQLASKDFVRVAQNLDAETFLNVAAPSYAVYLYKSAPGFEAVSQRKQFLLMTGESADSVKQVFDKAQEQLGAFSKIGGVRYKDDVAVACNKVLNLIACFGDYTYEHSEAVLKAALQKTDTGYKIEALEIAPIK